MKEETTVYVLVRSDCYKSYDTREYFGIYSERSKAEAASYELDLYEDDLEVDILEVTLDEVTNTARIG